MPASAPPYSSAKLKRPGVLKKAPPKVDTTLYQLVLAQLAPQFEAQPESRPDLALVQTPVPCSESWPLVIVGFSRARGKMVGFEVSDGQTSVQCFSNVPDLYNKLAMLELGAIVHLVGSRPVFDEATKTYRLEVEEVLSLKEFDAQLQRRQAQEARRLARLKEQWEREGYLEDAAEP